MDKKFKKWLFQDENIKKAYDRGEDVYAFIASKLFNKPIEDCNITKDGKPNSEGQRRRLIAKNVVVTFYLHDISYLDVLHI